MERPPQPVRAVNASLASIRAGLKPVLQDKAGNYFLFRNGQIRRQVGFGHSRMERLARRTRRKLVKASAADATARQSVLDHLQQTMASQRDFAALSFLA